MSAMTDVRVRPKNQLSCLRVGGCRSVVDRLTLAVTLRSIGGQLPLKLRPPQRFVVPPAARSLGTETWCSTPASVVAVLLLVCGEMNRNTHRDAAQSKHSSRP